MKTSLFHALLFLLVLFPCACDCGTIDLAGHDADTDFDQDTDQPGPDARDLEAMFDFDLFTIPDPPDSGDLINEPDPHEPYDDAYPPDPYVPDFWDVNFDYQDLDPDHVPDFELCGNNDLDPGEECDDGNSNDNDECTNLCLLPRCGDNSVWYGMEDCDPPGTTRPCLTECGTTGQEWCLPFCRWEGECIPPMETCGNGVDDDCDGVVDVLVRLTPSIPISDSPVPSTWDYLKPSRIVWASSEFAVLWGDDAGRTVLTRLDQWGGKVAWDRAVNVYFGEGYGMGVQDFFWTGSMLGYFWGIPWPDPALYFKAMLPDGTSVSDWLFVTYMENYFEARSAWSAVHYGVLASMDSPVLTSFSTVLEDGSSISDPIPFELGEVLAFPRCMGATGSGFVAAYRMTNDIEWITGWHWIIVGFDHEGNVLDTVDVEPSTTVTGESNERSCIITDEHLVSFGPGDYMSGEFNLFINARDGRLLASRALTMGSDAFGTVFTGSEIGFFWADERSGNAEIYFGRVDMTATPLAEDVRLTQTPAPSEYPSAIWDGSAYALTWHDSDGINDAVYFARFAPCP
jgi:cysteine-rich repeat protein